MSLFEIRSSPGKGLGVFATQHIPAGTLVVREKPLLTWDASAPPYQVDRSLRASFHALSVPEKLAAGALHCPMDMARSVRMIKELRSSIEDARNNPGAQEAATLSPLKAKKGKGTMSPNYRTLMAEAMARSKDLTDPSKEDLELYIRATSDGIGYLGPGGGGKETGLFPTAARLNHSCDPNVVFAVDRHRQYHLRARHDIEIGSELVVNYMPSFLSSATRKRETLENHSFVCSCRRCRGATPTTTALITDGGGTVRQDPGRVAATTQVAVGFVSATHLRTFNLIQHQAAAGIGIDPDELHHWILDLQKQEQRLRSMAGAAEEPVELFGVLYCIAEAYCGLGLVLKSPADIDKAILCLEKAASLGSKHWGSDDVFVREQRECIMDLRVRQAGFPSKK